MALEQKTPNNTKTGLERLDDQETEAIKERVKIMEEKFLQAFSKTSFGSIENYRREIERTNLPKLKKIAKALRDGNYFLFKNVEISHVPGIKRSGVRNFHETALGERLVSDHESISKYESGLLGLSEGQFANFPNSGKPNYFGISFDSRQWRQHPGFKGFGDSKLTCGPEEVKDRAFVTFMGGSSLDSDSFDRMPIPLKYADVLAPLYYDLETRSKDGEGGILDRLWGNFNPDFSRLIVYEEGSGIDLEVTPNLPEPFQSMYKVQPSYLKKKERGVMTKFNTAIAEVVVLGPVNI